jgi:hypothetical protein
MTRTILSSALVAFLGVTITLFFDSASYSDGIADRQGSWHPPNAFLCLNAFPSKYDPADSKQCGDGDMTLFNGLLCLSSEMVACQAVLHSKDSSGRWWRSPRRVNWEYPTYDVSFSPDQALGVLAYVLGTKDSSSFGEWLTWIESHRSKLTADQIKQVAKDEIAKLNWSTAQVDVAVNVIAALLPPRLAYCSDDYDARCTLRPGDCAIIKRVAKLSIDTTIYVATICSMIKSKRYSAPLDCKSQML